MQVSAGICPTKKDIFVPPFFPLQLVQAFTHAPAMLEADRGGKFHLVDGNVSGEFTDLVSACWRQTPDVVFGQKKCIVPSFFSAL